MGRPRLYSEKERKDAIRKSKTKYMLNKEWHCKYCDRTYSLAAKWSHIYTKKHQRNIGHKSEKKSLSKEEEEQMLKLIESYRDPNNKEEIKEVKRINPLQCENCGEEKGVGNGKIVCIKCGDTRCKLVPELDLNSWRKKKSVHLRDKWFSKRLIGVIKNEHHDLLTSDFRKVVHKLVENKYIKKNVSRYNFYIIRLAARRKIALLEELKDMAPGASKERFENHFI